MIIITLNKKFIMNFFIIATGLLLLLVSLLLVPIIVYVDTASNQYYVQLQGLIKMNLEKDDVEIFCS